LHVKARRLDHLRDHQSIMPRTGRMLSCFRWWWWWWWCEVFRASTPQRQWNVYAVEKGSEDVITPQSLRLWGSLCGQYLWWSCIESMTRRLIGHICWISTGSPQEPIVSVSSTQSVKRHSEQPSADWTISWALGSRARLSVPSRLLIELCLKYSERSRRLEKGSLRLCRHRSLSTRPSSALTRQVLRRIIHHER